MNTLRLPILWIAVCAVSFVPGGTLRGAATLRSPEQQRKMFKLPPGFEIQLIAAEPDIGQPMNLSFDARGRLWASHSIEYPYPARGDGVQPRRPRLAGTGDHAPRDRVTVFDRVADDGRPASITHFAAGLNIPIGQTPLGRGDTALIYNIPDISRFTDTDGDGRADRRDVIFRGFGNHDTHGMVNSFTRWIDGWIYGCHGFHNNSEVRDGDGRVTKMRSGNTYRFREDGSRLEQYTFGQVNPFGITVDPLGNIYTGDCHTMPLYMLLRGARYPHFGDPPDGLGFGPTMISHSHGSTGICGPAFYAADHFPAAYRGGIFLCNPVSGRIHHDQLRQFGSTYQCDTKPDFVACDDPSFRPVDVQLGPDGALYIADFYNPVIGHYEAPLNHPDRDRSHGRIWRIVYRGVAGERPAAARLVDVTKLPVDALVARLDDPNIALRTIATNYLVERHSESAAGAVKRRWPRMTAAGKASGLWILERLGALEESRIAASAADSDRLVRVHLVKLLAERASWKASHVQMLLAGLADSDPFVRRAAADALGRRPDAAYVAPLVALWDATPAHDTHLIHTIRLALREHLRSEPVVADIIKRDVPEAQRRRLIDIAAATDRRSVVSLLSKLIRSGDADAQTLARAARQIARRGSDAQIRDLLAAAPAWHDGDRAAQRLLFQSLYDGLAAAGKKPDALPEMKAWFSRIAPALLSEIENRRQGWSHHALPGFPQSQNPWTVRPRPSTDGVRAPMIESTAHDEQWTGIYRSRVFPIPAKLSFWICGHAGRPGTGKRPISQTNHVRLLEAKTGKILATAPAPRDDTAHRVDWNLSAFEGKQGLLEIVDVDTADAYAWIGVGRFDPAVVPLPAGRSTAADVQVIESVARFGLSLHRGRLLALGADADAADEVRMAALAAAHRLGQSPESTAALETVVRRPEESTAMRAAAAELLGSIDEAAPRDVLLAELARAPAELQARIARAMCATPRGAAALVDAVAAGKASARLFQDQEVAERLKSKATPPVARRVAELSKDLPAVEKRIAELIAQRHRAFQSADPSPERGKALFAKHCAACHQIGGQGERVGPQLDGVGTRGLARLLEDVLDPSRNVDPAFRTTIVATDEGETIVGLLLRTDGNVLVMADSQGKERRIAADTIETRRTVPLSAMPANVADLVKPDEFEHLLAYLLTLRTDPNPQRDATPPQGDVPAPQRDVPREERGKSTRP